MVVVVTANMGGVIVVGRGGGKGTNGPQGIDNDGCGFGTGRVEDGRRMIFCCDGVWWWWWNGGGWIPIIHGFLLVR